MVQIQLSSLQVGRTTDKEYYTSEGELLLSKGIVLSQKHIDVLMRRNISDLFIYEEGEDDELNKILSTEFKKFGELSFDDSALDKPVFDLKGALKKHPELSEIKPGKEGVVQLLKSRKGNELDSKIKDGRSPDKPVGPPLKGSAQQILTKERTVKYKKAVLECYLDALNRTTSMLNSLVSGDTIKGDNVRELVEQFVNTFLSDRSILLNISGIKHRSDEYIYTHSLNVTLLSINIAAAYGYNEQQVIEIGMGALLHDVGMLLLPNEVRLKKGKFTEDEWWEVQKHPILGLHLLEKVSHLPESVPYVSYQCHERENGKGYPKQRSTRLIHNYARIVSVADVFEALSSPRCYREAHIPYKAMELVIMMTRQGLISGEFVKALLEYSSLFPVGSMVELSNNCIGKVIRSNSSSYAKPVVCVLTDVEGNPLPNERIYEEDLSINTTLQIIRAHPSGNDLMLGF